MKGWVWALAAMCAAMAIFAVLVIVAVLGGDRTAVADLEVGECFNVPDDVETGADTVELVDLVECNEPHLFEVVGEGEFDTSVEAPPDDELFAEIDDACREQGVVTSDQFGLLPVAPTPERWDRGDGRYLCVAIPFGGELVTGSATER